MRKEFEKTLREYGSQATNNPETTDDTDDVAEHEVPNLGAIAAAAEKFQTPLIAQEKVFDLQKEKQQIMAELKTALANLDNSEKNESESTGRRISRTPGGQYLCFKNDRDKKKITLGDIMTDGEWGIDYQLDPTTISRDIRKEYLVTRAKIKLRELLNQQILINESTSGLVDEKKQTTYERILQEKASGDILEKHAGLVAEKMVKNFFKRITYNHAVDFEIIETDIQSDVSRKIDFIIRRKHLDKNRGVKTATHHEHDQIGIQFTINDQPETIEHKHKQIQRAKKNLSDGTDPVDDIILISLPLENITTKYQEWQKTKFSGGPEKLWDAEEKKLIFATVMAGILSSEEIEQCCERF